MKKTDPRATGPGPIELVEESFARLRSLGLDAWAAYYLGAVPFALGLLFFWSDMSQSGFAWQHELAASLGMTFLFLWLKCWQSVFMLRLKARIGGHAAEAWSFRRLVSLALNQAAVQPTGLILVPLAALLLLPFGWVFTFYQLFSLVGAVGDGPLKDRLKTAARLTAAWQQQNHLVLLILFAFAFFVALNVFSAAMAVPMLLKSLLGIESIFSRSNSVFLNTTFLAMVATVTWLLVDPLIKAACTLRFFYLESIASGEDLRVAFKHFQKRSAALAVLLLGLLAVLPAPAQETAPASPAPTPPAEQVVGAQPLSRAIDRVLGRPEYTWRIPKENVPQPEKPDSEKGLLALFWDNIVSLIKSAGNSAGNAIDSFFRWLGNIFGGLPKWKPAGKSNISGDWTSPLRLLVYLLLAALVVVILVFLFKAWRRLKRERQLVQAKAIPAMPDLTREDVSADQLPEDSWLSLARELAQKGELRLALRAYYLASLAHLGDRQLVTIARFKSNRDYVRELLRKAHAMPELAQSFQENVRIFERAWYGLHEVTQEMLQGFSHAVERMRAP